MARKTSGDGIGSGTVRKPWDKLRLKRRVLDPRILKGQDVNARYMDKQTFDRLVENIRTDGAVTGSVLVYQPNGEGEIEILSGHHRRDAAIAAEVFEIDAIVVLSPLTEARKRAIQLSHNSLVGSDDLGILAEMYQGLDFDAKAFSGLTDDYFGALDKMDLGGISSGAIEYQELTFHFLPDNLAELEEHLKHVSRSKRVQHYAARYQDFDTVFDAIVRTKLKLDIHNSALALLMMAELAIERLNEMEAHDHEAETRKAGQASKPKGRKGKKAEQAAAA